MKCTEPRRSNLSVMPGCNVIVEDFYYAYE